MLKQAKLRFPHFGIAIDPDYGDFNQLVTEENGQQSSLGVHGEIIAFPRQHSKNVRLIELEVIREIILRHTEDKFHHSVKEPVHNAFDKRITKDLAAFNKA